MLVVLTGHARNLSPNEDSTASRKAMQELRGSKSDSVWTRTRTVMGINGINMYNGRGRQRLI